MNYYGMTAANRLLSAAWQFNNSGGLFLAGGIKVVRCVSFDGVFVQHHASRPMISTYPINSAE